MNHPNWLQNPRNAKLTLQYTYTIGDKADDVLASFGLSDEDKKKYPTVREKFHRYFMKKYVIFECAEFNSWRQHKGEMVDNFIIDLHCLAESSTNWLKFLSTIAHIFLNFTANHTKFCGDVGFR